MEIVRGLLSDDADASRSTFADAVWRRFGFHDARGRVQRSGCIRALRESERAGTSCCPIPAPGVPNGSGMRAVWTRPSKIHKTYLGRQVRYAACV